jgi:TolB protein
MEIRRRNGNVTIVRLRPLPARPRKVSGIRHFAPSSSPPDPAAFPHYNRCMPPRLAVAVLSVAVLVPLLAFTSPSRGIFPGSTDIGAAQKGSSEFDPATATYRIAGGGADMWGAADAFHLDWQALVGDAALTAAVRFPPGTHPPNEKAVLIFRQSLDPGSMYADVAIHADGHITLQYRAVPNGPTDDILAPQHGSPDQPTPLRIVRKGDVFEAWAPGPDGRLVKFASAVIALHDPMYVGLGVCAHDAKGLATVTFSQVRIDHRSQPLSIDVN